MLFISHNSEDKDVAQEVLRRALEYGYKDQQLFLDSDPSSGIRVGTSWERELYESLKHTRAIIVICSRNWLESQWCFIELGYARAMALSIFPIIIDKCDAGSTLSAIQALDLTREDAGAGHMGAARDAAFAQLWSALEMQQLGPKDNLPWPADVCPFPGLMAFEEKFAPVFFGRELERDQLIAHLTDMRKQGVPRLLMIVGGSGSGKSSLLRAGVLPRLDHLKSNADWLVLPALRYGTLPQNADVTPLARLAREMAARFPTDSPDRRDWRELRNCFEADDLDTAVRDFFRASQDLCAALNRPDATTLLPIDQFEELLVASPSKPVEKFLRFLQVLLSLNNNRLLAIATMRSDYLDVYERHPHSLQSPFCNLYRLPPFPGERIREVIVKPAARVDVEFSDELVDRLKGDATSGDALPLLAFTLEKLFGRRRGDRLELLDYEALGGMSGALTQAVARAVPADPPAAVEEALRLSFVRHLAQLNDNDEVVRRTTLWSELPDDAKPLLEKFVHERLLHKSDDGISVEVSHEALFRSWDRLRTWLEAHREDLRLRRKLAVSAEAWNKSISPASPNGDEQLFLTMTEVAAIDGWKLGLERGGAEGRFLKASRDKRKSDQEREIQRLTDLARAEQARREAETRAANEARQATTIQRRLTLVATVVAIVAACLLAIALWQNSIARTARDNATQMRYVSIAQGLAGQVPFQRLGREDERGALLARQAYIFNERYGGSALAQVDQSLRIALDIPNSYFCQILKDDQKEVTTVAMSPDGTWLAACDVAGKARVWDLTRRGTAPRIFQLHAGSDNLVAFGHDGRMLATCDAAGELRLWDLRETDPRGSVPQGFLAKARSIAFSPDGTWLVVGCNDSTVRAIPLLRPGTSVNFPLSPRNNDRKSENEIKVGIEVSPRPILVVDDDVQAVAVSSDSQTLAAVDKMSSLVCVWKLAKPADPPRILRGPRRNVTALAFSPDGELLAAAAGGSRTGVVSQWIDVAGDARKKNRSDAAVWMWKLRDPSAAALTIEGSEGAEALAFQPGGHKLAVASSNEVNLWDVPGLQPPATPLIAHTHLVTALAFSPTGQSLASASFDGTVRLWDLGPTTTMPMVFEGPEPKKDRRNRGFSARVAISKDGRLLALCGVGTDVYFWDLNNPAAGRWTLGPHQSAVSLMAFSPDGQTFAAGCSDGSICLWNTQKRSAPPTLLRGSAGFVCELSFDHTGNVLAAADGAGNVLLWQPLTPDRPPRVLYRAGLDENGHNHVFLALAFHPLKQMLAGGDNFGKVLLWNVDQQGPAPITLPQLMDLEIFSLAFSPDGSLLLGGGRAKSLMLWDLSRSRPDRKWLPGHEELVFDVAFSPQGGQFVSASGDGTVRLWDKSRLDVAPIVLRQEAWEPVSVGFTPDGKMVAVATRAGKVWLWIARPDILADKVGEKVGRNLSMTEWRRFVGNDVPYECTCLQFPPGVGADVGQ